jgi:hypothetical protein
MPVTLTEHQRHQNNYHSPKAEEPENSLFLSRNNIKRIMVHVDIDATLYEL